MVLVPPQVAIQFLGRDLWSASVVLTAKETHDLLVLLDPQGRIPYPKFIYFDTGSMSAYAMSMEQTQSSAGQKTGTVSVVTDPQMMHLEEGRTVRYRSKTVSGRPRFRTEYYSPNGTSAYVTYGHEAEGADAAQSRVRRLMGAAAKAVTRVTTGAKSKSWRSGNG